MSTFSFSESFIMVNSQKQPTEVGNNCSYFPGDKCFRKLKNTPVGTLLFPRSTSNTSFCHEEVYFFKSFQFSLENLIRTGGTIEFLLRTSHFTRRNNFAENTIEFRLEHLILPGRPFLDFSTLTPL